MQTIKINEPQAPMLLREEFVASGRVQAPGFLDVASTTLLKREIRDHTEWHLAYTDGVDAVESSMVEIDRLPPERREKFYNSISQRAGRQFQYCFQQYYISAAIGRGDNPGLPLHAVHDFVNGEAFLGYMRRLTGEPAIRTADVLLSRYGSGHFLTDHDDGHNSRDRVAAYVLSLTEGWNPNWGGHLAFFDKAGNIDHAVVPAFNTLNVFRVPQSHAVQFIAPFALGVRTSLTGWVHR